MHTIDHHSAPFCTDKRQHLVVGSVIWDEEAQVGIAKNCSNANKASTSAWNDADILPGILALLSFAVMLIVQLGHGLAQRLDTGSRTIFSSSHANINSLWPFETTLNLVIDFGSPLSQIGLMIDMSVNQKGKIMSWQHTHEDGSSAKPCSYARSVHQITPVEARDGSSPAWGYYGQHISSLRDPVGWHAPCDLHELDEIASE